MKLEQSHSWRVGRRSRGHWTRWFVALAIGVLLAACDNGGSLRLTAETDEPHFRRGLQMARSGQNQVALEAFLKVIEKRGGDAPESHFEAGRIYLQHIKDPIAAIYHFRKNLELRPNGPQSDQIWQMVDTAKKQFATTLAAEPLDPQFERLELLDALEKLKAENETLRAEIARLGKQPPAPMQVAEGSRTSRRSAEDLDRLGNEPVSPVIPVTNPSSGQRTEPQRPANSEPAANAGSMRTYTVQAKDTLYGISVKFYGRGNQWPAIVQANSHILQSSNDLKPGMVLRIP